MLSYLLIIYNNEFSFYAVQGLERRDISVGVGVGVGELLVILVIDGNHSRMNQYSA